MEEVRSRNFSISQGVVESSAKEAILGSAIVDRHFMKKKGKVQCLSLIKVDLGYFFARANKRTIDELSTTSHKPSRQADVDAQIKETSAAALDTLKAAEDSAVDKTIKEGGDQ
jgi:hypothetical protein